MSHRLFHRLALLSLAVLVASPAVAADHRLGLGAHFWKTVEDLADDGFGDIEDEGYSYVVSYQYVPQGIFTLELDLEYSEDGFGGFQEETISPIGMVLVGGDLYAGVGIGVTTDSGFGDASDPFYLARIGWELTLLPGFHVDLNANYRAGAFDELENAETDAITLGAVLRFDL